MHDRYIIRDESFCAVLPSGIDERKQNKTVWSDIGYHNIDNVLNDFREESSPFNLVAEVTMDNIKKASIEENIQTSSGLRIKERRR